MNQENKLSTIIKLFKDYEIRSVWDEEKEDYYFSVVDVVTALTNNEYQKARNYWKWLKNKLNAEGSQVVSNTNRFKMKAKDGKIRFTDVLDTQNIFRLIESIPSPNAEPFKMWLAELGKERIDEAFDPSVAVNRAIDYYRVKGYSDEWIEKRLKGMIDRRKLTDVWKEHGIKDNIEYAMLTNEIYKEWSGMKASEYKAFKGIRKESLRDNMTDIEVVLTDLGEVATRELVKKHHPIGFENNKVVAKMGGNVAKNAKEDLEEKLGETVISNQNSLPYQYSKKITKK